MKCVAVLVCCIAFAGSAAAETYLVLPFSNVSSSQNLDWLGESMAETIRESLASEGLLALGREDREEAYRRLSIRPYRPMTIASAIRVAEALDADHVIFGSFDVLSAENAASNSRGSLRITAQVVNLKKAHRSAEFNETGAMEDLARLQNHLAWETLRAVAPQNAITEEEFRKRTPIIRLDAIEHYTRGLLITVPEQKLRFFSEAVRLDPSYSEAWFQLGRLQFSRKDYRAAAASLAHANLSDPHYREAQFYLGLSKYMTADYAAAEKAFSLVANAVPLNEVWNNLGVTELRRNSPGALVNLQKALEGDSTDPDYQYNVGLALFKQGKVDAAAERFRAALERNPDDQDAAAMLDRCQTGASRERRAGAPELAGRMKQTYEESAYLQLKAVLEGKAGRR